MLIVTGSLAIAGIVAVADSVVKSVAFYFHEYYWDKTTWGRPGVQLPRDEPDSEWEQAVEGKVNTNQPPKL